MPDGKAAVCKTVLSRFNSYQLDTKMCHTDCMIEDIPQAPLVPPRSIVNQSKPMLPFIVALVVVALISGGSVYLWQQNEIKQLQNNRPGQTGYVNNQKIPTVESTTIQVVSPTESKPNINSVNKVTLSDIKLTIPSNWKIESNDGKSAKILTDYQPYKVELSINLENDILTKSNYESGFGNTKTKYGEAFKVAQGGGFNVTGIKINEKLYSFSWEITSNEPIPSNLDGIWTPKHNVSEEDMWDVTISAEPIN